MAQFSIKTKEASSLTESERTWVLELTDIENNIDEARSNLRWKVAAEADLRNRIRKAQIRAEECRNDMQSMQAALVNILDKYETTEKRVLNSEDATALNGILDDIKKSFDTLLYGPAAAGIINSAQNVDDEDEEKSVSRIKGSIGAAGSILGMDASCKAEGDILGASYEQENKFGVEWSEDEEGNVNLDSIGAEASISGEVHAAKGSVEGNIGYLKGSAAVAVGTIAGTGAVGACLYKDGKLSPQIYAQAKAEAVAAQGEVETSLGTENTNIHAGAEGKVLAAEATAEVQAGKVTYEDKNGNEKTGYGIAGEVGAEACLASGTVSGGFTIMGIEIDVGLTGKAASIGGKASGSITTGGVNTSIGASLGLGVGLDLSIDWSGFKIGW